MHPIDNLFRERLGECEFAPNAAVWNRIEQSLDKGAVRKRFLPLPFLLMAAGIALAIGVSGVMFVFNERSVSVSSTQTVAEVTNLNENRETTVVNAQTTKHVDPQKNSGNSNVALNKTDIPNDATTVKSLLIKDNNAEVAPKAKSDEMAKALLPMTSKGIDMASNQPSIIQPALMIASTDKKKVYLVNFMATPVNTASAKHRDYWMVGGAVSPSQAYRSLDGGSPQTPPTNESSIKALNTAFVVKYAPSKRWVLESGVGYGRMGQTVSPMNTTTLTKSLNSSENYQVTTKNTNALRQNSLGNVVVKSKSAVKPQSDQLFYDAALSHSANISVSEVSQIKQMLDYIELPLTARYYISRSKNVALSVAGGVSANFLVENSAIVDYADGTSTTGTTDNLNDITYSSHVGVGFDVPLFDKLTMTLEPVFKYFLTSANHDSDYEFRPYSFGMTAGVCYRF